MDRIAKALKKFSPKERATVQVVFVKLKTRNFEKLDIQKLKGWSDLYRVRVGNIRIMYQITDSRLLILAVERRSSTTYSKW